MESDFITIIIIYNHVFSPGSSWEVCERDDICWYKGKDNRSSTESLVSRVFIQPSFTIQFDAKRKKKICYRFGPAGDPRGAGIGTPEAIKLVWSCHREIIFDIGPLPQNWELPPST